MSEMEITAIAPWFGGKRTLAPEIVRELGEHRAYWEPFCGSMAVLLAKPPSSLETVNDLHGDLINLACVIQHPSYGPELYRRLRRTLLTEPMHREAAAWLAAHADDLETSSIERAYYYFVASWMGRNGMAGTPGYNSGFGVRFTKNGGHAATRFASAVDSIPAWRRRLRTVTVLQRDGIELLGRIEDAAGVTVYVDPPYLTKGADYLHDFTPDDHRRLAESLQRFRRTRVVVSYYDDPRLDELYPKWTRRRLQATKGIVNQGRRDRTGAVEAPEVLLINGISLAEEAGGLWS